MSEIGVPEDPGNRRRILLVDDYPLMREHYGTYQDFSSDYIMNIAHRLVDPVTGFSATLNQTLLTCALRDIAPVTDSRTAMELLYRKYQRALQASPPTG